MSKAKEYIIKYESPFSRHDQQAWHTNFAEIQKHPHKMYYISNSKKAFVADTYYIFSSKATSYYNITSRHTSLLAMATDLKRKIENSENLFHNYFVYTLGSSEELNFNFEEFLSSFEVIHPFFTYRPNTLYYIQGKIKYYFMKTLDCYLTEPTTKENKKKIKKMFSLAIQPILEELKKYPETMSFKSSETLWSEFQDYITANPHESPFIKSSSGQTDEATVTILKSLFDLEKFFTEYMLLFHNIAAQHSGQLSSGQLFCLLLQSRKASTFLYELNKTKKISVPETLFQILTSTIEEKYKTIDPNVLMQLHIDMNREMNNVTDPDILVQEAKKFLEEKELHDKQIDIDTDFNKLDKLTLYMGDYFHNLGNHTDTKSHDAYFTFLNNIIKPEWDILFETDIYEAYTFEQLIYLELYHMYQSKTYIRNCANPTCNKLFVTQIYKTKYCSACSQNRTGANHSYRDKTNDRFHKIQRLLYNHCRHNLRCFSKDSPEKIALGKWRGNVSLYISKLSVPEKNDMSNVDFLYHIYSTLLPPILEKYVSLEKLIKKASQI